jgi:hypothetical protein
MQRMLFARLLLQDARVIVLDEPFNAIDAKTCADLSNWCGAGTREAHRAGGAARPRLVQGDISRRRCCSRASRWPGARPPRC